MIMQVGIPTRAIILPHVRRVDEFLRASIRCCFVFIEVCYLELITIATCFYQ